MDHQEILPKRKRADTIAEVADESQENPQSEGLPNVNHEWEEELFGIPLQLSDDDSSDEDMEVDSDEDYDNFWKDQKVIIGGHLANPTPEQMRHSPFPPSDKTNRNKQYASKTNVYIAPSSRTERRKRKEQAELGQLPHSTPTVSGKQTKLSFGATQAAPTVTQAAPTVTQAAPTVTQAAPVIIPTVFVEEHDDGEEELLLDSLVAGATGLDEITTEPLTPREVNEVATKLLRKGGLAYRQQQDLDLLQMYTANISKEGEFRARKVEASLLVARAKHPKTHGKTLARRIRGLYLHYRVHQSLPLQKRGG